MKKVLTLLVSALLLMSCLAIAEDKASVVEIDRAAVMEDFAGNWVVTSAYTSSDGEVAVLKDSVYLDLKILTEYNVLVDTVNYRHADVSNLQGELSFNIEGVDLDPYRSNASWNMFGIGASRIKIRDDDEGLFFEEVTGIVIEDVELMGVIALNSKGQLILGYSEDHIEDDVEADFEYAYVFDKVADVE